MTATTTPTRTGMYADVKAYIEWTPAMPGDEKQGFSYSTFTDVQTAAQKAEDLEADGCYIRTFLASPEQIRARIRENADARIARRRAEQDAARRVANTPVVGEGATSHYPQDKYPFVVVSVSPSGAKVGLLLVREVDATTGHEPAGHCNGFPVWDHEYTAEELETMRDPDARPVFAYRRKDGRYYVGGTRVTFGGAHYYRNHAD